MLPQRRRPESMTFRRVGQIFVEHDVEDFERPGLVFWCNCQPFKGDSAVGMLQNFVDQRSELKLVHAFFGFFERFQM